MEFTRAQLYLLLNSPKPLWLRGADLSGADLSGADLRKADLRGADLSDLRRHRSVADLLDLDSALDANPIYSDDLRRAETFESSQPANLRGADLEGASLNGGNLSRTDLRDAKLKGAELCGADLTTANLRRADLTGADLSGAKLREVDLREANLAAAELRGADLRGADLTGAKLKGIDLRDAALFRIIESILHETYPEQGSNRLARRVAEDLEVLSREARYFYQESTEVEGPESAHWGEDNRDDAQFDANLSGADLTGANLEGAYIGDQQLAQVASLEGAILPDGTKHTGELLASQETSKPMPSETGGKGNEGNTGQSGDLDEDD